ncbi:organic cation transporter protein [Pieris rapae]|uniref:organic cation transporter protein n=1 Tax=Pieris rapae TaxID=64459 RepID=UPI001E27AF02|nr:organic cation transporter protein [Pieris rapae]
MKSYLSHSSERNLKHIKDISKNNESKDPLDNITFKVIGDFGKWQFKIALLMALLKLPMAWYQLNILFLAPPQNFWCAKPKILSQYTEGEWRDICAPKIEEHPCLIFDPDILAIAPYMDRALIPLVPCQKFVYDRSIFTRTIISDWNLVCTRHWLIHFTQAVMMWGVVCGGILFPMWADKYGRKNPLMAGIVIQCIAGFLTSVVRQYWIFMISWFILAVAIGGLGVVSFVMSIEVVSGKWRTVIPILYQVPFGVGNAILAGLGYFLRDWRHLEFSLSVISSLFILYYFAIEESPRWLLATGQTQKAYEILEKAAKMNGREHILKDMKHLFINPVQKQKAPGFMAFIKSKIMRKNTVLLSLNWFCTGLSFFTFSQYLGYVGSNIYLAIMLSGLISIPGCLLCLIIITRFGRKTTVWVFQIISSFCFLIILLIPKEVFTNDWPRLLVAGIGFAGLSGAVPALFLYSGELFPTLGRNAGVGGVTTFARIASMVAPGIVSLDEVFADLPLILLAIVSFCQLTLLLPLPETKGLPLPDTLEDAERY